MRWMLCLLLVGCVDPSRPICPPCPPCESKPDLSPAPDLACIADVGKSCVDTPCCAGLSCVGGACAATPLRTTNGGGPR